MSRWQHEVRVQALRFAKLRLFCACGWQSKTYDEPTVSRLTEVAQDHRREAASEAEEAFGVGIGPST